MRSPQIAVPLLALVMGCLLYSVGTLADGHRGMSLIALVLVWCGSLIFGRQHLDTLPIRSILIAGIALRWFGFATEPFTSHDGLRYLADGAALLQGFNPLDIAYRDLPLEFRNAWPIFIEHQAYTTIYPPIALSVFAAAAAAGPIYAWWAWKAAGTMTSCLLMWFLSTALHKNPRLKATFFWVALHPLMVIETTVMPHIDLYVLLPVLYWTYASPNISERTTAWVLGLGALVKPTLLLGSLAWLPKLYERKWAGPLILGGISFGVGSALYLGGVQEPLGRDFGTFLSGWHFGSLLDTAVFWSARPSPLPLRLCVFLLGSTWILWRSRGGHPFHKVFGDLLIFALMCSPVVFPWYLIILAGWLIHRENLIVLWWSSSLLTYEVLDPFDIDTTWAPSPWPNAVTLIILMVWALSRRPT